VLFRSRILKVGPELTFSLREGLLALSMLEEELVSDARAHSRFRAVLDEEMRRDPIYWEKYYRGTEDEKRLARIFSYSDRCRYYLGKRAVVESIERLFANIDAAVVPPNMLHQYLPAVCDAPHTDGMSSRACGIATARGMLGAYLRQGVLAKYRAAVYGG
jgi:D-tagatose-1,6-bisphosphate aldolase subunit GatZ/KbaZ